MHIFTRKKKDNLYQVRTLGQEFYISKDEANALIETNQAFYKANKPVRSLKELESRLLA